MNTNIDDFFRNSSFKINDTDLDYVENTILEKIMSTPGYPLLMDKLRSEKTSESIKKMRECFINPEFYGLMTSEYFAPKIFTLTTKRFTNSYYEGLILNKTGFGVLKGGTNIHDIYHSTKMAIKYLDLYPEVNASKTSFDLEDTNSGDILTGTWKDEENAGIFGFMYVHYNINEDINKHPTTKDFNGVVYMEKNSQNFSETMMLHPVMAAYIINNYKVQLLVLKEHLDRNKR